MMRRPSSGSVSQRSSHTGNTSRRWLPTIADVHLAAVDEALDEGVGPDALVDEPHPLDQPLVIVDDRGARDADRGLLRQRLDDERERQPLGTADLASDAHDHELRHRDAVRRRAASWTAPCRGRASARAGCSRCTARAAARGSSTTFLSNTPTPWNDSSRLKTMCGFHSSTALRMTPRSSSTPSCRTSWPMERSVSATSNSIFHVGLGDVDPAHVVRRDQAGVHQREDAQRFHSATRCRPLCR